MAGTLTYQIQASFTGNGKTMTIRGDTKTLTTGDVYNGGIITVATASPTTLAIGSVATPSAAYFCNLDDANAITIYDDSAVLAVIPAEQAALIHCGAGVTLKAQAATADSLMDYTVFE